MKYSVLIFLLTSISPLSGFTADQNLDDQEIINIENLYKNTPQQLAQPIEPEVQKVPLNQIEEKPADVHQQEISVKSISDLNRLAPFNDISVIQKKYLPKTQRFQFFAGAGMTTNSPWYLSFGAKLNLGYNFTETWGVEASGVFLTNSEREAAKDIRANNSLQPEKFVLTKSNLALDIVWSPIYGKITSLGNRITPFDMYFSLGGGVSATNAQEKNVSTVHVGTGQIFAISKNTAFRWDYSWNMYQATPEQDVSSAAAPTKNTYNDLIFTAGFSFFFPEAQSR